MDRIDKAVGEVFKRFGGAKGNPLSRSISDDDYKRLGKHRGAVDECLMRAVHWQLDPEELEDVVRQRWGEMPDLVDVGLVAAEAMNLAEAELYRDLLAHVPKDIADQAALAIRLLPPVGFFQEPRYVKGKRA